MNEKNRCFSMISCALKTSHISKKEKFLSLIQSSKSKLVDIISLKKQTLAAEHFCIYISFLICNCSETQTSAREYGRLE